MLGIMKLQFQPVSGVWEYFKDFGITGVKPGCPETPILGVLGVKCIVRYIFGFALTS